MKWLVQHGWVIYPACSAHPRIEIPSMVGYVWAISVANAKLAAKHTVGQLVEGDPQPELCPIIEEIPTGCMGTGENFALLN